MSGELAKRAQSWVEIFSHPTERLGAIFTSIYGEDPTLVRERLDAFLETTTLFSRIYSKEALSILVRVPGRANLMGIHSDGQRTYKNYVALDKEILLMAQSREDDRVVVHNRNPRFKPGAFRITEELPAKRRGDWLGYINEVNIIPGDWLNYVKGGVLILQNRYPDIEIKGMNLLFNGNIPLSAGLSSSSALVVASALAIAELNNLDVSREELVSLCGQGEWYVGTRGGAGDQAAQLFCRKGKILHIRFTPTDFIPFDMEYIRFPSGCKLLVCNSMKEARKAVEAKDIPTARGVSQWIGTKMINKKFFKIDYLSDLISPPLALEPPKIYEILSSLPEAIGRVQLFRLFPEEKAQLESLFRTHRETKDGYPVRQVCLYFLAEGERGRIFGQLLKEGKLEMAGELMYIAHNGDRVASFDKNLHKKKWRTRASDAYLKALIVDWECGDSRRRGRAELYRQPGGFGCSCEELDLMVDLSRRVKGVLGGRLTGAGLGGCIIVLAEEKGVNEVLRKLEEAYYRPRNLPLEACVCTPVEGGCVLNVPD